MRVWSVWDQLHDISRNKKLKMTSSRNGLLLGNNHNSAFRERHFLLGFDHRCRPSPASVGRRENNPPKPQSEQQTPLSRRAQSSRKSDREGRAARLTPARRRTVPRESLAEDDRESLRSWAGDKLLASRVVLAPRRKSPGAKPQPRPRSATSAAGVEHRRAALFAPMLHPDGVKRSLRR